MNTLLLGISLAMLWEGWKVYRKVSLSGQAVDSLN